MSTAPIQLNSRELLGRGVNLDREGINIFDVGQVLGAGRRNEVVQLDKTTYNRPLNDKDNLVVSLPNNVEMINVGGSTKITSLEVKTGSEVIDSLKVNVDFAASFAGVSVGGGANYSYENAAKRDSMYALFSREVKSFTTSLKDQAGALNFNRSFLEQAKTLPRFTHDDSALQKYRMFFDTWGTHMIRECHFGLRYTLSLESANVSTTQKSEWGAFIKASHSGAFSVDASANANNSNTKAEYESVTRGSVSVRGGDNSASIQLDSNKHDEAKFEKWASSLRPGQNEAITQITVDAIPDMLKRDPNYESIGMKLSEALESMLRGPTSERIRLEGYVKTGSELFLHMNIPDLDRVLRTLYPVISQGKTLEKDFRGYNIQAWGSGLKRFELRNLGLSFIEKLGPMEYNVKYIQGAELSTGYVVSIEGTTGQDVTIGVYSSEHETVHMHLFPLGYPDKEINITFPQGGNRQIVLPSLATGGNYTAQ